MPSELIFVTGASGFLGSHIVGQLLEQGYRVRATARGAKVDDLKKRHANAGDAFEVVTIRDLSTDQFPQALQGVDALIHAGSPIAGRGSPEVVLNGAVEGSTNVIRQAEKAGIKKIVVTGSISAIINSSGKFSDTEWSPITRERALKDGDDFVIYAASKTLAEHAVWEFADAHPDIDITVLNAPFIYGPFARGFEIPTPNFTTLSTDLFISRILRPDGFFPVIDYIDVRDFAGAHVVALNAGASPDGRRKRLPIAAPYRFDWNKVTEYLATQRPDLKDRLADSSMARNTALLGPPDFKRLEAVIGMKECEFVKWQDTLLDTVDALVGLEEQWKKAGHKVDIPLT